MGLMSFRIYLAIMSVATLASWLAWVIVVLNTNPFETSALGFVLFYITLLMGLVGTLTLAGLSYRVVVLKRHDVLMREVRVSFRHAVLLSAIAVFALGLSAYGLLKWWAVLALVVVMLLVEYFFLVKEESRRV